MTTATITTTKRITLATIKSFIRKNPGRLFIKVRSRFDGMSDGLEWNKSAEFVPAADGGSYRNTLGIAGAWFVGSSRDYFEAYDDGEFTGYKVANCCGYFTLAIRKG